MRGLLHLILMLLLALAIAFSNSSVVLADEGEVEHALEMDVNGIHVTLTSQNDWKKGEKTIVVTLMDSMGMPVRNADVEISIGPKLDEHADHANAETTPVHGAEQGHSSMPGMEMGEPAGEISEMSTHEAENHAVLLSESQKGGTYTAETLIESSGAQEVTVMFHVSGDMLQADFIVEVVETISKAIALWSFAAINVVLITSAGILKKQPISVKGR